MKPLRVLGLAALVVVVGTCEGPRPGWLQVQLVSPNANDGGVLFTVGGGPVDSVRSSFPDFYAQRLGEGDSWRVLVAGTPVANVIAEIWVPDVGVAASYTGTVEQVAHVSSYAQRPTAGYQLSIGRSLTQ
jgi:hypothetical protein